MAATATPTHDIGDVVRTTATFTNTSGAATDPTQVTFRLRKPDGAVTVLGPASGVTGGSGITRTGVGAYYVDVTIDQAGFYDWRFEGTGAVTAAIDGELLGASSPFYPAATPLADNALVTLKQAEVWLNRHKIQTAGETEDDIVLSTLINGASSAVENELDRKLRPLETAVARRFRYDGSGFLDFAPYELRNLTSLVVYTDLPTASQWTLLAQTATVESEYRLEPRQRSLLGTYDHAVIPRLNRAYVPNGEHEATVTGDWGVTTVPGDIQWVVLEIVRLSYPQPLPAPDELGGPGPGLNWIPRQLMDVLGRYRRVTVG